MIETDVTVLFGATGDLTRKLLLPALYRLEEQGKLHQRVIGVALDDWTGDRFRAHCTAAVAARITKADRAVVDRLVNRMTYVSGDYRNPETFLRVAAEAPADAAILHYLAIPPHLFESVIEGLAGAELLTSARILVEKPFGRDLESARHLNAVLRRYVPEAAVYRIDHFLGKEPVENLLAFRYANTIVDAAWNRQHIDHIQVTMAESFGVADRGKLYDSLGVVRDVVQNHILQVVCLLTMESPSTPSAADFAAERSEVLRTVPAIERKDVVYGQYDGYRTTNGVDPRSNVPTYAALRLSINAPRWHGVPIFVRAGKAMATTSTFAAIVFQEAPPLLFAARPYSPPPNQLVFRIGPSDGIDLFVQAKRPGEGAQLATTRLTVDYDKVFGRIPMAYERVLEDALHGDRSQFADEQSVEEAWRIVNGILDPEEHPASYPKGSWGPATAEAMLGEGRSWIDPA